VPFVALLALASNDERDAKGGYLEASVVASLPNWCRHQAACKGSAQAMEVKARELKLLHKVANSVTVTVTGVEKVILPTFGRVRPSDPNPASDKHGKDSTVPGISPSSAATSTLMPRNAPP
jgi:hypothetical protein